MRSTVLLLALALPAFGQLDSAALRAKFGAPLNRETFHVPQGFDLVVDYGASGQVCRIEVPPLMPTTERVSNLDVMHQRMLDFLLELVPDSVRGKEINRSSMVAGANSVQIIDYEHVSISETQNANQSSPTSPIRVLFKSESCRKQP